MTKAAFDLSEKLELPVMVRSVTRISHASGDVLLGEIRKERNAKGFNKHYEMPYRWNVYGPPGAIYKHKWLHEVLSEAVKLSEACPYNIADKPAGVKIGVVACGIAAAYTREALSNLGAPVGIADGCAASEGAVAFLKLGFVYPLPESLAKDFLAGLETLLVIEEGDPLAENMLRSLAQDCCPALKIRGRKRNAILPPYGELNTDTVMAAIAPSLGKEIPPDPLADARAELAGSIVPRSSTLCAGCSHLGAYAALKRALADYPEESVHIVNGDIGCYEQAGYGVFASERAAGNDISKAYAADSPYEVLDTLYVMGSGLSMAHGQSQIGYAEGKIVAVCGDSTFFHAILPALVNVVYNKSDLTLLILDNRWTCMTGHQPNPATGLDPYGAECPKTDIPAIVKACGCESLSVVDAYDLEASAEAISAALAYKGPSVVVMESECQLQVQRRQKKALAKTYVKIDVCDGCKSCVRLGCPAVKFDTAEKKSGIDAISCVDCGLCLQVCPSDVIKVRRR